MALRWQTGSLPATVRLVLDSRVRLALAYSVASVCPVSCKPSRQMANLTHGGWIETTLPSRLARESAATQSDGLARHMGTKAAFAAHRSNTLVNSDYSSVRKRNNAAVNARRMASRPLLKANPPHSHRA